MLTMSNEKGVIVIIAFLTLGIMLLLGAYFLSFSVTESRISKSEETGKAAYYLAEAGINQAIWKLRNDQEWSTCFVSSSFTYNCDCDDWSAEFNQDSDPLIGNSEILVSIQNSACGSGELVATSTIASGSGVSQRVVKAKVFKATGDFTEHAFLGGGNVVSSRSTLTIHRGNLASDGNINLERQSTVNVYDNQNSTTTQEGQVLARGNVNLEQQSVINASSTCGKNVCTELCEGWASGLTSCPSPKLTIPIVDFDSSDPNSYKSKAQAAQDLGLCKALCNGVECSTQCIYSQEEFEDLLSQVGEGGTLTLTHSAQGGNFAVYYIDGRFKLRGRRNIIIQGALVVDNDVTVGEKLSWEGGSGANQITIQDPGEGIPSGILSKRNFRFGKYASLATTTIEGLFYALGNLNFTKLPNLLEMIGGQITARNFRLTSVSNGMNIYLDSDIILEGIFAGTSTEGLPAEAPVVKVEHWEESY